MAEYDASAYGERIADVYDQWPRVPKNVEATVEFLATRAGPGPVLELGIGTGRVALPLAERGLFHGIDASPAMVAKLRAKPGGDRIPVVIGNFVDMGIEGRFLLVFVVFNTFFALLSQDDQVRCFKGVAEHLTDDGVFVIEAFVPDPTRWNQGQRVGAIEVGADRVHLETSVHDPLTQRVRSQRVVISDQGIRLYPVWIRYAWPSELDLMARLAGLRLRERWAGWSRELFTATSATYVSVYGRGT
ncbi:MAG: class I SAM-dependent methyltransferase [Candidatus Rokubacteria bacterium]|nr:class I SAM-dependent methyltransferase [Candidatus Rokubacteria bacterium]